MGKALTVIRVGGVIACVLILFVALSSPARAQEESTLRSTIRAALIADPRTAALTDTELEQMVSALEGEAEAQGFTPEDIVWRPYTGEVGFESACGDLPYFLCALNQAFGFDGSDLAIPFGLGVSSALLLFLIGMLLLRLGHHPIAGAFQ